MNYDEALLTYTEVAVAFAGFSALVTAIRDRGVETNPHLWLRLRGMVELALLVAAFSVGAISIRAFGVADGTAWRVCSGVLAVVWAAQFVRVTARAQRLHRAGFPFGSRAYRYFLYSIAFISTASLVTNAMGWWSPSGAVYFADLPEMIVVAIPNTDRTRDLTPTHSLVGVDGTDVPEFETSGGNDAFFGFLGDELIPRIDSLYATSSYRMLVGHSFGGITALNALYTIPETFDAYVAIDPSLWWDDEVLLRRARSYFTSTDLAGKALYVAQANTIDPDRSDRNAHFNAISRFNELMRAYDESGIRYAFRYYDDDDHGSVPLIAEYDALHFVFDGYRLPLRRVMEEPSLLTQHFRDLATGLGLDPTPPLRVIRFLVSATMAQDTANALAFVDVGEAFYPDDHSWSELRGDVAAARGQTEAARAHYEDALAKSDNADHVREKLEGLARH